MSAKVYKVDNISVTVFDTPIDGVVEIKPPKAANREKDPVSTVEGCVGYTSRIVPGETEFTITTMSNQYQWLSSIVDTVETGTIIFSMPGAVYTMYNAIVAEVTIGNAKDSTPEATVKILYTFVKTDANSYDN